jgi:hypothetical protein
MAHTYMRFEFGTDEEKAQEARHKLDVWKQAFRLDQKLQYKLERPEEDAEEVEGDADASNGDATQSKSSSAKAKKSDDESGVGLLVRLYFSTHEKNLEKQWLERIPSEEPFKSAGAKMIRKGQPGFDEAVGQFGELDKTTGRRA